MVYLKIFVNDKLLLSYAEKGRIFLILAKLENNKYGVAINYQMTDFEFDKLD